MGWNRGDLTWPGSRHHPQPLLCLRKDQRSDIWQLFDFYLGKADEWRCGATPDSSVYWSSILRWHLYIMMPTFLRLCIGWWLCKRCSVIIFLMRWLAASGKGVFFCAQASFDESLFWAHGTVKMVLTVFFSAHHLYCWRSYGEFFSKNLSGRDGRWRDGPC